jgi:hypothetical protein
MCKHVQHLGEQVRKFQEITYPHLTVVLSHALQCNVASQSAIPEKKVAKDVIQAIQSEFHSLITYEQKLVFPAILQLFDHKHRSKHTPDLAHLLQLTKSKEHKLHGFVGTLYAVLQTDALQIHSGCEARVVSKFEDMFFPEKQIWNQMIADRINHCACFRKNMIQASGFHSMVQNTNNE